MKYLIDRELLKSRMYEEAFEKESDMQRWDSGCWIRYKLFENVLAEMPVEEPKTGKWTVDENRERTFDYRRFYCSCCGNWTTYGESDYCPNCGAKMTKSGE